MNLFKKKFEIVVGVNFFLNFEVTFFSKFKN